MMLNKYNLTTKKNKNCFIKNLHLNRAASPLSAIFKNNDDKSSPEASWDSKVSTVCALRNLAGSSRSSGYFSPTVFRIL